MDDNSIDDNIINYELLTQSDKDDLQLNIANLVDLFIFNNPLIFSNENFESILFNYIYDNVIITLQEVYPNELDYLQDVISDCYISVKKYYFVNIYPLRSFKYSPIRKSPNYQVINKKINLIENKPQPDQRTKEWYEFRHNLITASSAWKALKSDSCKNQLILEKCKDLNVDKFSSVNTGTAFHHGNKYEDVSIMYYENKYKTKIKDYGCIKHDKFPFLGASPDGINIDPSSDRYGRMLEIKNPVSREITGIPKEEYWIQMQLQMETCDLNECDFLETSFKEYDSEEDFEKDGTFLLSNNNELKGVIMYFIKNGKPHYEYKPIDMDNQEYSEWYENIMEKNKNNTWMQNIYWRLEKYSCVLVLRNKFWFKYAIHEIEILWKIIEKERITGHEHRNPKKNNKPRSNSLNDTNILAKSCLINVNKLQNQIIYINTNFESLDITDISGISIPPID